MNSAGSFYLASESNSFVSFIIELGVLTKLLGRKVRSHTLPWNATGIGKGVVQGLLFWGLLLIRRHLLYHVVSPSLNCRLMLHGHDEMSRSLIVTVLDRVHRSQVEACELHPRRLFASLILVVLRAGWRQAFFIESLMSMLLSIFARKSIRLIVPLLSRVAHHIWLVHIHKHNIILP